MRRQSFDTERVTLAPATVENPHTVDTVVIMIHVHRLTGQEFFVNAAHIISVEPTPDTLLHLMDGSRLLVRESVQNVCAQITGWFREVGRVTVLPFEKEPQNGGHPEAEDP